jgi:hypothetical protein
MSASKKTIILDLRRKLGGKLKSRVVTKTDSINPDRINRLWPAMWRGKNGIKKNYGWHVHDVIELPHTSDGWCYFRETDVDGCIYRVNCDGESFILLELFSHAGERCFWWTPTNRQYDIFEMAKGPLIPVDESVLPAGLK